MKVSKSAVFLFELMIVILVFTLAAVICVQIFAGAFNMSAESHDLTMSSINAQTVAEQYKAGIADIDSLHFDSKWNATDEAGACYTVELDEKNGDPKMREAYINVFKKGHEEPIFSLHVKEFTG